MTEYVYIPVAQKNLSGSDRGTISSISMANQFKVKVIYSNLSMWFAEDKVDKPEGHFIEKSWGRGIRPLSGVSEHDLLTIIGHGKGGDGAPVTANSIAFDVRKSPESGHQHRGYTAPTFARRIQKDGLTKDIRSIRLLVCYSGMGDGSILGGVQVARDCLACLLAKELGKLGYSKVVVAGFTGEVVDSSTSDGRARIKIGEGSVYQTLSESERKFDSKGKAVT